MKYPSVKNGRFLKRLNRFIAEVEVEGEIQTVHVKNTGRLREILLPEAEIVLEDSQNPARKTRYSLIGVYKGTELINIDSQVPNQVAFEGITTGKIVEIGQVERAKKEVTFGQSRFDIFFEAEGRKGYIEVKGVTLEEQGEARFPDAPTARGARHVHEMMNAVKAGYEGYILFLIQMKGVKYFTPNNEMDPEFAQALATASRNGVKVLAYDSIVTPDEIRIGNPVEVRID